jgi:hypothetical protein
VGKIGTSTATKEEIIDFYDEIYGEADELWLE